MYTHISKPQESMYHTFKHMFTPPHTPTHNDLTFKCGLDYSVPTFFWWREHNCGPHLPRLTIPPSQTWWFDSYLSWHMFYMKRHSWNSLNVCRSHQRWTPQYMFHPLVTEVILLRLSLGLRPLIRENVSSLWQPVTHRVKKGTISSIFSTAVLWVRVQASVCLCVMTVSCDVAMTTDYAQRDRLERKISLRLRKAVQVGARPGACKCQFFEGRETEERWFMLKIKRGPTATGQNSVISSTGPLIISAQPITALWNISAWREVRPETVTSLQPPPSSAGRKKWHHQPAKPPCFPWLNGML